MRKDRGFTPTPEREVRSYGRKALPSRLVSGFTIAELLVYIGILAIVVGSLTGIFLTVTRTQNRESASAEVTQQLDLVLATVQRLVRDASLIELAYEGSSTSTECSSFCTLLLRTDASSTDPTLITSDANGVYVKEGSSATATITTDKVLIDYVNFAKREVPGGHASVQVDVSLTFNSSNPQFAITKTLQSAVGRVSAATFDSDVLPNVDGSWDIGSITGSNLQWRNARLSGDFTALGNVAFGTSTLVSSAILTLNSTTTGFLPPRVPDPSADITSPATGLLAYNSTLNQYEFYNGTVWGTFGGSDTDWTDSGSAVYNDTDDIGIGTASPIELLTISGDGISVSGDVGHYAYTSLTNKAADYGFFKASGSEASPGNVSAGGDLGAVEFKGYYGGAFRKAASVAAFVGSSGLGPDDVPGELRFMTADNGDTDPVTRLTIQQDGDVILASVPASGGGTHLCHGSGKIGMCSSLSKYKKDINDLTFGLGTVMELRPRTFYWKTDDSNSEGARLDLGFVAEEVEKINPLLVTYSGDELVGVKYENMAALLVNAIKELKAQNDELRARIEALEAK